jgi:2,3-bisphosphoglycerate-independent phosphoglycerate mutase
MEQVNSHGGEHLAVAVKQAYEAGQTDYSMEPLVRFDEKGTPVGRIQKGDAGIFCCRRGEREIELTEAFTNPEFSHFEREDLSPLDFIILTLYHEKFIDLPVAFLPSRIEDTLAETVSRAGLRQFHCSESEKFAHVTFFLNGGNNQPFAAEEDHRVPSPKGIPFDQVPELSLPQVSEEVVNAIGKGYDLIVTNFVMAM